MNPDKQERAQHKLKHIAMYNSLQELVDDWCSCTGKYHGGDTVYSLMNWAKEQCQQPTEELEMEK